MRDARDFKEKYKAGTSNFPIYGLTYFQYQYINDTFKVKIDFDPALISIVSLDIEVAAPDGLPDVKTAEQPITAITLTRKGRSITFGMKPFTPKSSKNEYIRTDTEEELLSSFISVWSKNEFWIPDVVTGWSIEHFDIPYLVHRIIRLFDEKEARKLSPNRWVRKRDVVFGKTAGQKTTVETVYELSGLSILDYIQLYKRYTFVNHESYSLKHISKTELGKTKVDFSKKYKSIDEMYDKDPQLFFEYNIEDAFLVEELENKLNFIQQVIAIAYRAKINYIDALTTARPWDVILNNHLLEKKIVIHQYEPPLNAPKADGGFCRSVNPGLYKYVLSIDFDGLYPRLISQQNISPETFIEKTHVPSVDHWIKGKSVPSIDFQTNNVTLCGNGTTYRKDKRGFIPEVVDQFIDERDEFKRKMIELKKENELSSSKDRETKIKHLDNFQKAWKILTNGLYGAMLLKYFRWYNINLAEAITLTGQLAVQWIIREINSKLNRILKTDNFDFVIAADTDSAHILSILSPLLKNSIWMRGTPPKLLISLIRYTRKFLMVSLIRPVRISVHL